ncbi:MAG: GreA/GreB family elongation factor [Bacteroidales bacterium]|nr:GreA/GreB family elongation factor [Bacteroidales bacterium]
MSRGFVKEGDQEEVPMILPRAFLPSGVTNCVTPEGLRLLHDEMESLKEEWSAAGSNYVTKNYLDAKMRLLSERISSAVVVDTTKANPDVVSFGMYVRYNDKTIRIVGVDEADASKGLISFLSPIAKSLIGKKKGDKFEIKVPRGTETIEIQEVATFISTELRAMSPEQNTVAETVEVTSDVHERTRKEHEKIESSGRDFTSVASEKESSTAKSQKPKLPSTSSGTNPVTEPVEVAQSSTANSQQPKLPSTSSGTNPVTEPVEVAQSSTVSSQQTNSPSTSSGTNPVTEPVEVTENTAHGSQLTAHGQKTFTPQDAPTDFLPLVNEQGNIVGRALHCQIHNGNKVLHPAVHLIVINTNKETVGKYCWHVAFGETAEKTLKRKISDIISCSIKPKFKKQYIREDKNEKELVYVFTAVSDAEFLPSPDDKEYERIFERSF